MSIISLCLCEYNKSVFIWLQICVCMSIISLHLYDYYKSVCMSILSLCLYDYYKSVFVWVL